MRAGYVSGKNIHDMQMVEDSAGALQTGRRLPLWLDKGYDAEWLEVCLKVRRYEPHIPSGREASKAIKNSGFKAHRWMKRFRRILIRWEKKAENHEAMLHFACDLIARN